MLHEASTHARLQPTNQPPFPRAPACTCTFSASPLISHVKVGDITLAHRVVMSPLTRLRNSPGTEAPNDLVVQYYKQRASKVRSGWYCGAEAVSVCGGGGHALSLPLHV